MAGSRAALRPLVTDARSRLPLAARYLAADLAAGLWALVLLALVIVVAITSVLGVGLVFAGLAARSVRRQCDRDRARTGRLLGRGFDSPYAGASPARLATVREHLRDGTLVRDVAALAYRAVVGIPLGLLAVLLPVGSLIAAAVPLYWWAVPEEHPTPIVVTLTSWWDALGTSALGLAGLALWSAAPTAAVADARVAARLLAPSRGQELRRRVELEEHRRRSGVSAHTAELRRIERDLHDATQNRLVAVAMFVGMAQRQVSTGVADPAPALAKAQSAARDALAEMRRVIRGIYPAELAEEGLIPTLGLLVDRAPVPTRLHVERPAPTPAAVDAALYFSIAEALTNVIKHSGADNCEVHLSWAGSDRHRQVSATITDNGRGGADPARGSGLTGIEQRVAALDGDVRVDSPPGGPTTIRMTLPCES